MRFVSCTYRCSDSRISFAHWALNARRPLDGVRFGPLSGVRGRAPAESYSHGAVEEVTERFRWKTASQGIHWRGFRRPRRGGGAGWIHDAGGVTVAMMDMPNREDCWIAPSLLSADFAKLGDEVRRLEEGGADWLHFDVMDGRFVPNLSIGIPVLQSLRRVTRLPIDVHLMIVEPDSLLGAFAKAGADSLCVQAEACTHLHRTLQNIRALGCRAGVAFNPHTEPDCLEYVADLVDFALVMTVNPGFGGQSYIDSCTAKIARIRSRFPGMPIEVDGGVKADTISRAAGAGANIFVSGSGVFSHGDYGEAIATLRRNATQARGA